MFPSMESNPVVTRGCQIEQDHRGGERAVVSKDGVKELSVGRSSRAEGQAGASPVGAPFVRQREESRISFAFFRSGATSTPSSA